ncbi:hypothetical protein [Paraburkholderia fungorum]|uniref:hypothetical protein n=1 Tax=Paraburkholderia fungorum TaxID=134537 RepID=UPI001C1F0B21|nr:hypothetical protein [Paraburkholderia fungorum]MBU7442267.1 hypothetical protein [Paraburkholderia fungorum]
MKLLWGLHSVRRRIARLPRSLASQHAHPTDVGFLLPAFLWNTEYRTAGGFRCIYLGTSTAWESVVGSFPVGADSNEVITFNLDIALTGPESKDC